MRYFQFANDSATMRTTDAECFHDTWGRGFCVGRVKCPQNKFDSAGGRIIFKGEVMGEEQRQSKLLGQRYRDFEDRKLAGSVFRDQHGAFGWYLHWFGQGRILDEYWFDNGDFFETVTFDDDGHWKCGDKLTEIDPSIESCMRETMNIWENEERKGES
jgi:hypothetical protein